MAAGPIKRLRYRLEYGITLVAAWFMRHMSPGLFSKFARFLGSGAYFFGVSKRQALANLRMCFPDKPEREIRAIAKKAYRQFAESVLEIARMPVTDTKALLEKFDLEGMEVMDRAKAEGRGAVCLSAHYGSWELMGAAMVERGYPMEFAMGVQSNPWVDQLFMDYRAHVGIGGVRIHEIRPLIKSMKAGKFIALLGDQDGDKWGIFTSFFGVEASTFTIAELLARKTGGALFYGVARRKPDGRHFMKVQEIPEAPAGLNQEQAVAYRLQYYNDLLEADIRTDPTQWLWMHHRWEAKALHRLQGEDRKRAEAGEIYFDTKDQVWREKAGGGVVEIPYWK